MVTWHYRRMEGECAPCDDGAFFFEVGRSVGAKLARLMGEQRGGEWGIVSQVNDNDTIGVVGEGWAGSVRLLGIDGPELWHPRRGREKGALWCQGQLRQLVGGKQVVVLRDRLQPDRDRYGRRLRHVLVGVARRCVQAEMVWRGAAWCRRDYPCELSAELRRLELGARRREVGIWRGDGPDRGEAEIV
jgi:endonuclease YncB( thermonuclease family)